LDIVQLGLSINTTQIDQAKIKLDSLTASSDKLTNKKIDIKANVSSIDSAKVSIDEMNKKSEKATALFEKIMAKLSMTAKEYQSYDLSIKNLTKSQIDAIAVEQRLKDSRDGATNALKQQSALIRSATKEYQDMVNKITMTESAYKAAQLASKGWTQEQIQHIQKLQASKKATDDLASSTKRLSEMSVGQRMSTGTTSTTLSSQVRGDISSGMSASGAEALRAQARAADEAARAQNNLGESVQNNRGRFDELHRILAKTHDMLIRMAAYRAINIIGSLPSDILDVNVRMESLRVQLEGITGSAGQAKAVFKELLALDIKTPFDIEGLAQTWIRLKNYGLEPTVAVMKSLTDGVSRLGGGTDVLNRVSLQLGQAWAKNKLQLQDMKPMMDAGIPVIQLLADKMHVGAGAILGMSHAGTIGHKEIMLLLQAIEEWAPDASIRAMGTLKGQISNVSTAWIQFQDALLNNEGEGALKSVFKGISDSLFSAIKYIDEIISSITILASILAVQAVSALIAYADRQILANAAARSGAIAMAELTSSAKLLNIGLVALVSWEIGSYLNKFETIRRVANDNLYAVLVLIENLAYGYERLAIAMSDGTSEEHWAKLNDLKKAHIEALKPLESLISADNAYAKGAQDVAESVKYKTDAAKKDMELAEQSEKIIKSQVKALEDQSKLQESIAKATNAQIDSQIRDIDRLSKSQQDSFNIEKKANDDAFSAKRISLEEFYNKELDIIERTKQAKIAAINAEILLNKQKIETQIDDVSKAYQVIKSIESSGKEGQVNKTSYALGQGQVLPSTLANPGFKMASFPGSDEINKLKGDYQGLVEYVKAHEEELSVWGEQYFNKLVLHYKSIPEAVKHYGDGTKEYMDKFVKGYDAYTGATEKQIKTLDFEKDKSAEVARITLDAETKKKDAKEQYNNATKDSTDALEQERIKYLELTGQIKLAIQAKHDLAIKKVGVIPGTPATPLQTAQIKTIDATAINDATTYAEKYQNRLEAIDTATKNMGVTSTEAFDIINKGFGGLANALNGFGKSMDNANKSLADHAKQTREDAKNFSGKEAIDLAKKNAKTFEQLEEDKTLAAVTGARQIFGATASLFAEQSRERKALHNVEIALSAIEMALSIKKMAVNIAEGASKMFGQSGWGAFIGVAAMLALMAGLGYASGGSGSIQAPPEYSKDTGTVLGDPTAKSESINNTYELLKDLHADEYAELRGINKGIADLSGGITDVITRLYQAGGLKDFATVAPATNVLPGGNKFGSPIHQAIVSFLFGGKQTQTVTGAGISTDPTSIADIMAGGNLSARQFATIETKTKGGLFTKTKTSYSTQYAELDAGTQKALNSVFNSMGNTMLGLADNIGHDLSSKVNDYIIPALTVDLKGLDGEAAAKKLNGVISAALDTMATSVFGDILGQYQQLGEGMLETAVRIVAEVAVVEDSLSKSGLSITGDAISISDALVQAAGGLKEFQSAFDSYYQKFYTDAERNVFSQKNLNSQLSDFNLLLPNTRDGYRKLIESLNVNNEADAKRYSLLIKLSGAADDYYSILEDQSNKAADMINQQRDLDIQYMELTGNAIAALTERRKDELAAMDESLRWTTQAIWLMTDANKAIDTAMNVLKKSVADKKADDNTIYQAALAANNLQKTAANDLLSAIKTVAANIKTAIGSTVVETEAFTRQRRIAAQNVLQSALLSAKSGGSLAGFAGLDQALSDISQPVEQLFSTFVDFARDQGRTGNVLTDLANHTGSQISVAEQTVVAIEAANKVLTDGFNAENIRLDAIITTGQSQIDAINGTTGAVMTVQDAVSNLAAVINAQKQTQSAIRAADEAVKVETAAKANYDYFASIAAGSAGSVKDAVASANKAATNAAYAAANAANLQHFAPAPTTYQNGQSGNAIWEQILGAANAEHTARFGIPMNRPWTADSDAARAYQNLVARYNEASVNAALSAQATADGLAAVAVATAALIPGYQAAAAIDQDASAKAQAAYNTASSYATAAKSVALKGFASGGYHDGGWRIVGEHGPELEQTGPSHIYSNSQSKSLVDNSDLIAEIRALRQEVSNLKASSEDSAKSNRKISDLLRNVTQDGQSLLTTAA
jgi:tape measure domain-containing protein